MSRRLLLIAALSIAIITSMAVLPLAHGDTLPGGIEGCIVNGHDASGPSGPLTHATTCTYTSTRTGGYVAQGNWTLSITVGTVTTTYTPANAPKQGCALWGPGATVTVSIRDSQSGIAAGNPVPAAADGTAPPNSC